MAKKNKSKAKSKSKKCELTYHLDHPQIKRHESPGNGNAPGSVASSINFGGKGTAAPKPAAAPKPSSAPKSQSIASKINFGGKFKK